MITSVMAAGAGLQQMGRSAYLLVVGLGSLAALAVGIIVSLRNSVKSGFGAGLAAFFGGVILSVLIVNALAMRDMGSAEFEKETGYHSSMYGTGR